MTYALDLIRTLALGWSAMFIGDAMGGSMWAISGAIVGLFAGVLYMIHRDEMGVYDHD